ncbi:MAG TPA: flavin reductase family protein [Puia sp.]|nr:flavin reductase family protein [Puia sp.]
MIVDLKTLSSFERQGWLQAAVAPRPVCFASTIDGSGQVNLSPFSFFNMFSSTPPILIFSPARRVRDNTTKHTWHNVQEVPEVVINIVDYSMVQQVSLASCEYPKEVNEFTKAGFSEEPATLVRPPMVRESKVKIECKVIELKTLGEEGGAGNLVICEAMLMHIDDSILDDTGKGIDQHRIQQVARLGGDWYCKADGQSLFRVEKPNTRLGIGMDALPAPIRNSRILSGNGLGRLANVHEIPVVDPSFHDERLKQIFQYYSVNPEEMEKELHVYAAELLEKGLVNEAWQVLLALN